MLLMEFDTILVNSNGCFSIATPSEAAGTSCGAYSRQDRWNRPRHAGGSAAPASGAVMGPVCSGEGMCGGHLSLSREQLRHDASQYVDFLS